jgi:hypothetical protein
MATPSDDDQVNEIETLTAAFRQEPRMSREDRMSLEMLRLALLSLNRIANALEREP